MPYVKVLLDFIFVLFSSCLPHLFAVHSLIKVTPTFRFLTQTLENYHFFFSYLESCFSSRPTLFSSGWYFPFFMYTYCSPMFICRKKKIMKTVFFMNVFYFLIFGNITWCGNCHKCHAVIKNNKAEYTFNVLEWWWD